MPQQRAWASTNPEIATRFNSTQRQNCSSSPAPKPALNSFFNRVKEVRPVLPSMRLASTWHCIALCALTSVPWADPTHLDPHMSSCSVILGFFRHDLPNYWRRHFPYSSLTSILSCTYSRIRRDQSLIILVNRVNASHSPSTAALSLRTCMRRAHPSRPTTAAIGGWSSRRNRVFLTQ